MAIAAGLRDAMSAQYNRWANSSTRHASYVFVIVTAFPCLFPPLHAAAHAFPTMSPPLWASLFL